MFNPQYIKLRVPEKIKIADDPDSPFVDAGVAKILIYHGLDENHLIPHIPLWWTYGFITSTGKFLQLTSLIHKEEIVDIVEEVVNGVPTGTGINPISGKRIIPGNWFTDLITPNPGQSDRRRGDFRIVDLYRFLKLVIGIDGTIEIVP